MDSEELKKIIVKVDKERKGFANKASLDTLSTNPPTKLIKRVNEVQQLVGYLLGYKDRQVVPVVSIYGRSGTGKSTVVKFVCNYMKEIKMGFANLRKAKTVFGGANLILNSLNQPSLKSAQGINVAIERIQESILESMDSTHKLFVLVLDEFDVLFYDKRGNPSDFVYKLVEMQSELKEKGCLCMIITISNNVLADYSLDERVKSRIGNSEIFFPPYTQEEVLEILQQRAKDAFDTKIDEKVLELCANLSYLEHGDARRSVELLRVASELAMKENKPITVQHVNQASEQLQKDRIEQVIKSLSYHSRIACMSIAANTYIRNQRIHSTASLYNTYKNEYVKDPLSYRRFSEILKDLENTGILESRLGSKSHGGYNSEYSLIVQPEIVGKLINEKVWNDYVMDKKQEHEFLYMMNPNDPLVKALKQYEKEW